MSSINTNAAAMTALQTLQMTNKKMEATQNAISTGLRVASASDNAAYWSIATTMRSDNKAMSTVQDALGLGTAQVDVSYTAMNSVKDLLDEVKSKLVAAKQPGVDKAKVQAEINQLQEEIQGISTAASFSGTNWLSVDSSGTDYTATKSIVSSFSRNEDGTVTISTIDVDASTTVLFDASSDGAGLLQAGIVETGFDADVTGGTDSTTTNGEAASVDLGDFTTEITLADGESLSFTIDVDGGGAETITIDADAVNTALSASDGTISDAAEFVTVLNSLLTGATASASGDTVSIASDTTSDGSTTSSLDIGALGTDTTASGIADIDITTATDTEIDSYIASVETMSADVITAASDLGAIKKRIDIQMDFVTNLMDAIDRGIGQLVDADMNEESTKLQALQVQQQLGIQALSIANSNSQNILALFR